MLDRSARWSPTTGFHSLSTATISKHSLPTKSSHRLHYSTSAPDSLYPEATTTPSALRLGSKSRTTMSERVLSGGVRRRKVTKRFQQISASRRVTRRTSTTDFRWPSPCPTCRPSLQPELWSVNGLRDNAEHCSWLSQSHLRALFVIVSIVIAPLMISSSTN